MSDLAGLVFPFFGLIFLGFFVARLTRQPLEALGWMNLFIIYVPPRGFASPEDKAYFVEALRKNVAAERVTGLA